MSSTPINDYTADLNAALALGLAQREPSVAAALRILGDRSIVWPRLYVLLEIIEHDARSSIEQTGWATQAELTRFVRTANSFAVLGEEARHGPTQHVPPGDPMDREDAEALIRRIAAEWLTVKLDAS